MSSSAAIGKDGASLAARRENALSVLYFLLISLAFVVRFCISPELMNEVVEYTSDTGAFYEKLHFGTYAILLLVPVVLFTRPVFLRSDDIPRFKALFWFTLLIAALVGFLIATGRAGSSGFFIDTYLVAGVAGLLMYAVNPELRRAVGAVVLGTLLLSALMGILEAVTETRILPYGATEEQFRPIGLTDHPLTLGMMCATTIGFVTLTRWPIWARVCCVLLLFIGTAASGARFSLLLAAAEVLALLLLVPWTGLTPRHQRQAKTVVLIITLAGGAALIAVMFAAGLLSRFGDTLFDKNYMARITIYQIFDYVTWKDILFGANLTDILRIVNEKLKLPFIESTPVMLTFQLGAIVALLFAGLVFWIYARLLRHTSLAAWIATGTFMLGALSNNTLSSKTPVVATIIVLIIAFAPQPRATSP